MHGILLLSDRIKSREKRGYGGGILLADYRMRYTGTLVVTIITAMQYEVELRYVDKARVDARLRKINLIYKLFILDVFMHVL